MTEGMCIRRCKAAQDTRHRPHHHTPRLASGWLIPIADAGFVLPFVTDIDSLPGSGGTDGSGHQRRTWLRSVENVQKRYGRRTESRARHAASLRDRLPARRAGAFGVHSHQHSHFFNGLLGDFFRESLAFVRARPPRLTRTSMSNPTWGALRWCTAAAGLRHGLVIQTFSEHAPGEASAGRTRKTGTQADDVGIQQRRGSCSPKRVLWPRV